MRNKYHCGHHAMQINVDTPPYNFVISTLIKNRVGDDGVPAILQYRPSDLYPTDRKEVMAILQKDTHTPLQICK